MKTKEYHQSQKAIIASYLAYRWIFALLTYGVLVVYDFLKYKNTKLAVSKDSFVFTSGLFSAKARQVPYMDIQSLSVHQSALGKHGDYGTVTLHLKDNTALALKFTATPKQLAKHLHRLAQASGASVESAEGYPTRQQETEAQALADRQQKRAEVLDRTGKCPRCGNDNLQAVTETRGRGVDPIGSTAGCCMCGPIGLLCGIPGAGSSSSKTMRMCLSCGKKFR